MRIILVTGGARGGKSRYAQERAWALGGSAVTFIATADASDDEMARRIERHRAARPSDWATIEAPRDAGRAVLAAETDVVLLDCLNVLAANALTGRDAARSEIDALAAIDAEIDGLLSAAASRDGLLIVVSNEVGFGVHPPTALGRWFRDGLGIANQRVATIADEVVLMVAGVPLHVKHGRAP
ncbi:MAG: bifunctional adenosylcobinamide kinase/adenosylcobinamide-phosphate guanylyltransferase [Longimicrobiales bacterium]